jgi:hypothetical protein
MEALIPFKELLDASVKASASVLGSERRKE